jgi:hypothetical protein
MAMRFRLMLVTVGVAVCGLVASACVPPFALCPCEVAAVNVPSPAGIAFDGSSIWVANSGADTVSKIDPG